MQCGRTGESASKRGGRTGRFSEMGHGAPQQRHSQLRRLGWGRFRVGRDLLAIAQHGFPQDTHAPPVRRRLRARAASDSLVRPAAGPTLPALSSSAPATRRHRSPQALSRSASVFWMPPPTQARTFSPSPRRRHRQPSASSQRSGRPRRRRPWHDGHRPIRTTTCSACARRAGRRSSQRSSAVPR
jgi:hypothetical protein